MIPYSVAPGEQAAADVVLCGFGHENSTVELTALMSPNMKMMAGYESRLRYDKNYPVNSDMVADDFDLSVSATFSPMSIDVHEPFHISGWKHHVLSEDPGGPHRLSEDPTGPDECDEITTEALGLKRLTRTGVL